MSSGPRGSDAGAASSSAPQGEAWPPLQGALQAGFAKVKQQLTRLVFQIDAEQEARMRAYLDQTYGDSFEEGRRGRDRPIQMNSLRCVPGSSAARLAVASVGGDDCSTPLGEVAAARAAVPGAAGCKSTSRPWAAGRPAVADARARPRRPPKPVERVAPPPTSLDEEVARRLYDQLDAAGRQKVRPPCKLARRAVLRGTGPASGSVVALARLQPDTHARCVPRIGHPR